MSEYELMDRLDNDNSPVERILRSSGKIVLLLGPAASGKTSAALDTYRRFARKPTGAEGILLLPNAPAVNATRRKLLKESPNGIIVAPQVMTFSELAGKMLRPASGPIAAIRPFHRHILLHRIVDELLASDKLSALTPVAQTPGLVPSLDETISELKRAAIEPAQLARAIGKDARTRDLLTIYQQYQKSLQDAGTYDLEGRMWTARDTLADALSKEGLPKGLSNISAVIADGFTDFTPTQLDILDLLSNSLQLVLVTLPLGQDGRDRMWHWTNRTLETMRARFRNEMTEMWTSPRDAPLRVIWDSTFKIDADEGKMPNGLALVAAAGQEAEVSAVARRVKKLLVEGSPAGSIAVLARSMGNYRDIIDRVFAACDIPMAPTTERLADVPVIRFAFDAADLAPQFAYRDVLSVVSSSYFIPEALGPYGREEIAAAQMIIREGNVLFGRQAYRAAGQRLANRLDTCIDNGDDDEPPKVTSGFSVDLLISAIEMLESLFSLAESATDAVGFAGLIDALQIHDAACRTGDHRLIGRDLRAIEELNNILNDLPSPPPAMDKLRMSLRAATSPAATGQSLVDVLDILAARQMRYDHVFLLGLSEGQFPHGPSESSLIRQSDRDVWRSAKVELDSRSDLTAREMLLFYLAISRADKSLTITYCSSGPAGQPSQASTFLLSALDPFGGLDASKNDGLVEEIPPGNFIGPLDQIASAKDAFNAAISGLFEGKKPTQNSCLSWAVANADQKLIRAAMGLLAHRRRWKPGQFDHFDGQIDHPELLARLGQRFPDQTLFSASSLNSYGQCPWQFFAREILHLVPLREPTRHLEPIARGLLAHDVLFRTMNELRRQNDGTLRLGDCEAEDISSAVRRGMTAAAAKIDTRQPPYPALWQMQKRHMVEQIERYLLDQRNGADDSVQLHFELAFGLAEADATDCDPASQAEPIEIPTPAGKIRLRGKIDRVDQLSDPPNLLVIDYKTGTLPSRKDIEQGRSLQLPIYTEAIEQILSDACAGGAFHRIGDPTERHFSQIKPPRGDKRNFTERRREATATIGRFVGQMSQGHFPVLPSDKCPKWCPYRRICHFSPARMGRKASTIQSKHDGKDEA